MKKIMVHFAFPDVTLKQYDDIWKELKASGHSQPKGLIYHAGGINGNKLIVFDIWESQEAFTKFGEILGPLLAKNNLPQVQPVITPVHYETAYAETGVTY
jgi:hypothetical protein